MASIIEARGLVKRYKDILAVDGIDFSVEPGECFGFLGPNGAGKTTTMRMMCCISPLTQGELLVNGQRVSVGNRGVKSLLGVVPQEENFDPDLSVLQNLLVYARFFDIPRETARERALESLEVFQLLDRKDSPIDSLSSGMKRRLLIARALLNHPKVLVLDEPTTGLDPQARHLVWQILRSLQTQGSTLVLSTHYMEEAAYLCDRLVIMHQGKILVEGTPKELVSRYIRREVVELRLDPVEKSHVLERLKGSEVEIEDTGDVLYLFGEDGDALGRQLGVDRTRLVYRPANLEDVFLRLTGRELKE